MLLLPEEDELARVELPEPRLLVVPWPPLEALPPVVAATQTFGVWLVSHTAPGRHVPPAPQR